MDAFSSAKAAIIPGGEIRQPTDVPPCPDIPRSISFLPVKFAATWQYQNREPAGLNFFILHFPQVSQQKPGKRNFMVF